MKIEPTLIQGEIPLLIRNRDGDMVPNPKYPSDCRCKSGHVVPHGTRFFAVAGKVVSAAAEGVYCEFCLQVANKMGALLKKGLPVNFDPQQELEKIVKESTRTEGRDA